MLSKIMGDLQAAEENYNIDFQWAGILDILLFSFIHNSFFFPQL